MALVYSNPQTAELQASRVMEHSMLARMAHLARMRGQVHLANSYALGAEMVAKLWKATKEGQS